MFQKKLTPDMKPVVLSAEQIIGKEKLPACGQTMKEIALHAEKQKFAIVSFSHPYPPIYTGGIQTEMLKVTLADSTQLNIPKDLIHVPKTQIGVNGFVKLKPDWQTILTKTSLPHQLKKDHHIR